MSGNKEVFLCGVAGAVSSLFGKLALSALSPAETCAVLFSGTSFQEGGYCTIISTACSCTLYLLMIACNAYMFSTFLIALKKKGSLMVVIVSSSTNIILTGVFGQFILGENVGDRWYAGAFVMMVGVALIAFSQDPRREKSRIEDDDNKNGIK